MIKFNDLLNLRLKSKEKQKKTKMTSLAELSNKGSLSSFSGIFKINKLNDNEKEILSNILRSFREKKQLNIEEDLKNLITITAEVKAITNQAIMLHGERIKKAQEILKNYKEGAFSSWLVTTYGNRQTPYNFLQYYEFYMKMPQSLKQQIDAMPRQAIYTLASRMGDIEKKQEIIKKYQDQPKQKLLSIIRKLFPLSEKDKRQPNLAKQVITSLKRLNALFTHPLYKPTIQQKEIIQKLLIKFKNL